ncbi:PIN_Pae0151-like domain containing protein [Sphingobium cupriresistens]
MTCHHFGYFRLTIQDASYCYLFVTKIYPDRGNGSPPIEWTLRRAFLASPLKNIDTVSGPRSRRIEGGTSDRSADYEPPSIVQRVSFVPLMASCRPRHHVIFEISAEEGALRCEPSTAPSWSVAHAVSNGASRKLAIDLNHPAYDCAKLATAMRHRWQFVTADSRFLDKVRQSSPAAAQSILSLKEVAGGSGERH